ncbi:hypothetical protein F5884DRAFT_872553 [Xylogone sp. PMI_703]|nr:hypothetical protein F5884DRAFT_872553 [Xylogone sp. PMI_703]
MAKEMSDFKVVIVGGSVAGLTLAHAFDRANIDYVLLEGEDVIAPEKGAAIFLAQNGARILDQLGVYDHIEPKLETLNYAIHLRGDNGKLTRELEWPKMVNELLGYPGGVTTRSKLLLMLYDRLKDKSRILTGKRVVKVENLSDSVAVFCKDGASYTGSIVVGADGIHSKVRKEMRRNAVENGDGALFEKDETIFYFTWLIRRPLLGVTAEYSAIFGMTNPLPETVAGSSYIAYDVDKSGIVFTGQGGALYFFFVTKLDKKYLEKEIPRFGPTDMKKVIEKHGDFNLAQGHTLRSFCENSIRYSYHPLEEATHNTGTYKRIVCIGDAIHKMTPNFGQGGNQAIESAAVLASAVWVFLNTPNVKLEDCLKEYQRLRQKRANAHVRMSRLVTEAESLTSLRDALVFLYPPLTDKQIADRMCQFRSTAPILNYLPPPLRSLEPGLHWKEGPDRKRDAYRIIERL